MGLTAGIIVGAGGYVANKLNTSQKKKDVQDITVASQRTSDALQPVTPPPAPSALNDTVDQAKAMTAAARRYRMQQTQGFSSTLLTGASGDRTTAPSSRKTLLGL
jgi:hypothetical protein